MSGAAKPRSFSEAGSRLSGAAKPRSFSFSLSATRLRLDFFFPLLPTSHSTYRIAADAAAGSLPAINSRWQLLRHNVIAHMHSSMGGKKRMGVEASAVLFATAPTFVTGAKNVQWHFSLL